MHVYKVGGCVRDRLMRQAGLAARTSDTDWVVTGATPEDMIRAGFTPVGADFPVFLHPATHEEYALARTERKTAKGYHGFTFHASPEVTLEEDLRRRDLTINAMAEDVDGRIIDPWGGRRDLQAHVLRHVSEAFAEDPVRILRLARFAARFPDFRVAGETLQLCRKMVENGEADALVPERTWQELRRGLAEADPVRMIDMLQACGLWQRIFADIVVDSRIRQALKRAAARGLDAAVRAAILFSNYERPEKLRGRLQALRLEAGAVSLAELVCRLQRRVSTLRTADDFACFLEAADVLRRPERFARFLEACTCLDPALDAARIQTAAQAYAGIDAGAAARAAGGKNVREAVRKARAQAVAAALDNQT